jgi:hypothetical protein
MATLGHLATLVPSLGNTGQRLAMLRLHWATLSHTWQLGNVAPLLGNNWATLGTWQHLATLGNTRQHSAMLRLHLATLRHLGRSLDNTGKCSPFTSAFTRQRCNVAHRNPLKKNEFLERRRMALGAFDNWHNVFTIHLLVQKVRRY